MKIIGNGIILVWMMVGFSLTGVADVPRHFYMHGSLTSADGQPWPDGDATVLFQISGTNGMTYREEQWVTIIDNALAVFVGEGTAEGSAGASPTEGIPMELVTGSDHLYIDAWIEGQQVLESVEVGSLPYAMVSQTALTVAPGAIHAEHLDQSLQEALLRIPVGDFAYIKSDSIEGALNDIDTGLRFHEETIKKIGSQLTINQSTLADINSIPGIISGSKIDATIARQSSIADINTISGILSGSKIDDTMARQSSVDTINQVISDIDNIPGVIDEGKIPQSIARISDVPIISPDTTHLSQMGEVVAVLDGNLNGVQANNCTRKQKSELETGVGYVTSVEIECIYRSETLSKGDVSAPVARHPLATLTITHFPSQGFNMTSDCCTFRQRHSVPNGNNDYTLNYLVSFTSSTINANQTFYGAGDYHLTVYEIKP